MKKTVSKKRTEDRQGSKCNLIAVFKYTQIDAKKKEKGNNLFSLFFLHSMKKKQFNTTAEM